jgi:hypothetical protein
MLDNINFTGLATWVLNVLLALAGGVVTRYLIPWLKSKTATSKHEMIQIVLDTLVRTAEQVYGSNAGEQKKAEVLRWLDEKGLHVDDQEIEAAVYRLKEQAAAIDVSSIPARKALPKKPSAAKKPAPAKASTKSTSGKATTKASGTGAKK